MKPTVIALANQKGGVGKTTTAVNLRPVTHKIRCCVGPNGIKALFPSGIR